MKFVHKFYTKKYNFLDIKFFVFLLFFSMYSAVYSGQLQNNQPQSTQSSFLQGIKEGSKGVWKKIKFRYVSTNMIIALILTLLNKDIYNVPSSVLAKNALTLLPLTLSLDVADTVGGKLRHLAVGPIAGVGLIGSIITNLLLNKIISPLQLAAIITASTAIVTGALKWENYINKPTP